MRCGVINDAASLLVSTQMVGITTAVGFPLIITLDCSVSADRANNFKFVHVEYEWASWNDDFSAFDSEHLSCGIWHGHPLRLCFDHSNLTLDSSKSNSASLWTRPLIRHRRKRLSIHNRSPTTVGAVCRYRRHLCRY